ncbi:uncharacterized protein BT62DRAFT_1079391 [Guyanagaster necrorhizus]|uniref:Uncharacterized protein n=1 Tax=Guyanagaster necrorhizus TaxID=856835 RepID=A0A9P7VLQ8_9AGAR|nr:uncharacterized protein BT62DRAFT_1079391 [Guyanagaster necrorhizus MCA 3950]KAG7442271.1 hypothetical protein BT62DRAFT_1079391 [Guyanagaster necrorhizus MCA 3950]
MPTTRPWITFACWREVYGNFCSESVTVIIPCSSDTSMDLLVKRSPNYSDRPHFTMVCATLRMQQRLLHNCLNARAVGKLTTIQENEIRQLLKRLLEGPEKFHYLISRLTADMILRITYGYDSEDKNNGGIFTTPGACLVDQLPSGRHSPPTSGESKPNIQQGPKRPSPLIRVYRVFLWFPVGGEVEPWYDGDEGPGLAKYLATLHATLHLRV